MRGGGWIGAGLCTLGPRLPVCVQLHAWGGHGGRRAIPMQADDAASRLEHKQFHPASMGLRYARA